MILGIGNDLCDIRRIEKSLERFGDRFVQRIFTEIEQKRSHAGFTFMLLVCLLFLGLEAGILSNDMQGVTPEWLEGLTGGFRSPVEGLAFRPVLSGGPRPARADTGVRN